MEVDAAGGLEDAMEFDHALRHHREVRHHVVLPEEGAHGGKQFADLAALLGYDILIGKLGLDAPAPCVVEGGDLRRRLLAAALAEEDIVRGVGVEGRVEVDEVNALVGDMLPQDVEIVAEVEVVGGDMSGQDASSLILVDRRLMDKLHNRW